MDNFVRISRDSISERQWEALAAKLTFEPNPETRVSSYRERKSIKELWLPRGAWDHLPKKINLKDLRSFPKLPKYTPNIVLDYSDNDKSFKGQKDCIAAMYNSPHQQGVIHRAPGTGKTNIAMYFIATVGTRTLVIVHTEDLLNQWLMYAERVLPMLKVGVIRQGNAEVEHLTIAMLQTLYRRNYPESWWRQFGCTIMDEVHHCPASTFDEVLSKSTSRYRFGLSASHTRADRMQPLIEFNFGSVIHDLPFNSPVPVTVHKVNTGFDKTVSLTGPTWLRRKKWQGLIKSLTTDPKRNGLIAERVNAQLEVGRSVLVLSRRIEHLQLIQELIEYPSELLAAALVKKPERIRILDEFRAGNIKCVLATQLADEALDVPILSCVALTFPAKHSDHILQQVGRALREHKGKDSAVILDFVDHDVSSLNGQWHMRRKAYRTWGFKIIGDGFSGKVANLSPTKLINQLKMF